MENSTGSANRTTATPYGRACPPVASLPSPRRFASAYRGRWPLKNGWPTARHLPGAARRAGANSTACAHIEHRGR
ncbi:hypothetical protein DTY68_21085 [Escherichia coli]|nr:hypothetical protein [Escherichia coli]EAB9582107.1 hypothetical protein [Escherichia coli]